MNQTASIWMNQSGNNVTTALPADDRSGCVVGGPSSASQISQIMTQVIIAVLMFGLGCTTDVLAMWNYMKQPKQVITALLLQLIFNPFCGLAITQIFQFSKAQAMGTIIAAVCPGGAYSNIASYWLDGDMNLSIVLTCLSTLLALGTMPLWLYVLPRIISVTDECLKLPFEEIGYALLAIIAPVLVGLAIKHKFPKVGDILTKVCTILGSLGIIAFVIVFLTTLTSGILDNVYWGVGVAAFLLPTIGFVVAYLSTRIPWFQFQVAARRTVAIETMMQNIGLAIAVTTVSYDFRNPLLPQILPFIFIYGFLQIGFMVVIVPFYLITKWRGMCMILQVEENGTEEQKNEKSEMKGEINNALEIDSKDKMSTIA